MTFEVERCVTVWCVKEDLPFVGNNSVASVDCVCIEGFTRIKVENEFTSFGENNSVHVPFCVGYCLGTDVLDVVHILIAHVDAHVCFRCEGICEDVVGFNNNRDDSCVTCIIVEEQGHSPLCALETACCRGQIGLTECCRWSCFGDVVCTGSHGLSHPVGWSIEDPVSRQSCSCSRVVAECNGRIALHVMCSIATG